MTPTERERIEHDAIIKYGTPRGELHVGYIDGAVAEHDKARNQAIDACKQILKNQTVDHSIIVTVNSILNQMEDLKNETI